MTQRQAPDAVPGSMPGADEHGRRGSSARLTAANAEARKPMNVSPSWVTARNRPGSSSRRLDAPGAAVALVDELLDPAAPDRDEGDLGGDEERLERGSGRR